MFFVHPTVSQSATKDKDLAKTPAKKQFILQNCAVSATIIPPLDPPRKMMFQVFDRNADESMIFGCSDQEQFDLWLKYLQHYCPKRPPVCGIDGLLWKLKISPDGVATPSRRRVYVDDEKIMYWKVQCNIIWVLP